MNDDNGLFSKENLLKYTPTNVIKVCFAMAFITFCLVFMLMMSKAADIPVDRYFNALIDVNVEKMHGAITIIEYQELMDYVDKTEARLTALESMSHNPKEPEEE